MADNDETLLRDRLGAKARPSPSQLLSELDKQGRAAPKPPPGPASAPPPPAADDDAVALPQPGDAYAAHSRIGNKPETMLSLLLKDWSIKTFAYSDLRFSDFQPGTDAGKGPVLLLRFIGVADVRLEGRHLFRLVDPLRRHRLAWLAELPGRRDFADESALAITGVSVKAAE